MNQLETSVILFAHGSKASEANDGIVRLAQELSRQSGFPAQAAFLEIAQPDLAAAMADACRKGARRVIIVRTFLRLCQTLSHLPGSPELGCSQSCSLAPIHYDPSVTTTKRLAGQRGVSRSRQHYPLSAQKAHQFVRTA